MKIQKRVLNPVVHLGWKFLRKQLTVEKIQLFSQKVLSQMFDWVFNTSLPALHIICYILELRITTRNLLLALDPSQQSSSPFSPNFIYINHLQVVVMYLPPFINHLKITLKVLLKQKSKHLIVQCLSQHPLKASTW